MTRVPSIPAMLMIGMLATRSAALQFYKLYRQLVIDVRQLVDLAEHRADLDTRHGLALAGYSMGS